MVLFKSVTMSAHIFLVFIFNRSTFLLVIMTQRYGAISIGVQVSCC